MSTVGFHTFGCKLNYSETSSISRIFQENSYRKTSIYKNPEKIIINTCSVTENANKKCKDLIKKIKKYSPESKITVIGCGRSNEEKKIWKDENTSDDWKKTNIEDIQKRMEGWQLESFKESYKHKTEHGISLLKKKMINETK